MGLWLSFPHSFFFFPFAFMGSASSNAEKLEKRRIEREMRLGLYSGHATGLNPSRMGMRPVNPYQHLGWPAPDWLCDVGRVQHTLPPPPPQSWLPSASAVGPQQPRQHIPQPRRQSSPAREWPQKPLARAPSPRVSPAPPKRSAQSRERAQSPTLLRWTSTPLKREAESPTNDLLTPAGKALRYLQSQVASGKRASAHGGKSPRRHVDTHKGGTTSRRAAAPLKPSVKQAVFLLLAEEVEERADLLKQEVESFDVVLSLFSLAVERELIRVAAFEMFELEKKARKAVASQERRERHILEYWAAENCEDVRLSEGIRGAQSHRSPQRTPSGSPRRLRLSPSEDRYARPSITKNAESLLASPSPIPPKRPQQVPLPYDSRFA